MKKLKDIIDKFNIKYSVEKDILISGISQDSRVIKKNYIFLINLGDITDSKNYIKGAIENGAAVIFSEKHIDNISIPVIIVNNLEKQKNLIAQYIFNNPQNKIKIIGITGTNGKTTTAFFLKKIIEDINGKCGMIGTTGHYKDDEIEFAYNTTPPAIELTRLLGEMIDKGIKTVVIEVSSWGLFEKRVNNIRFDGIIFTSFEREHLELHKTMENYFKSKLIIFSLLKDNAFICINKEIENKYLNEILKYRNKNTSLFSKKNINNLKVEIIDINKDSTSLNISNSNIKERLKINIPGIYNILNALAAISAGINLEFPIDKIIKSVNNVEYIPGRMEKININSPYDIFIDYAHSKEGLENVLSSMHKLKSSGNLIVVFGCGGDRDIGKRSLMGKAADKYADIIILTSDNPRSEDPKKIIKDIEEGKKKKIPIVEVNRERAIKHSLNIAKKGDLLLILGKGHETYQETNGKRIYFNDKKIVEENI